MTQDDQPEVYVFWDNSNIFIPAQHIADRNEGISARYEIRIHFANMFRLAAAGRQVKKAVAVGSVPPDQKSLWDRLEADTGITPELYERGSDSGTEQGVDQCLQTHMLRALADEREPQIAVLLTGDGKGYDDGVGFHADLERMQKEGWGIEVISWDKPCRRTLKDWARQVGVFVRLDDYYDAITFREGTRTASRLNLRHRMTTVVDSSRTQTVSSVKLDAERQRAEEAEAKLACLEEKERKRRKYNDRVKKRSASTKKKRKKGRR